jgi:hypothetical protein
MTKHVDFNEFQVYWDKQVGAYIGDTPNPTFVQFMMADAMRQVAMAAWLACATKYEAQIKDLEYEHAEELEAREAEWCEWE